MNRVMWVRDAHSPWDRAGEPDFRDTVDMGQLFLFENFMY